MKFFYTKEKAKDLKEQLEMSGAGGKGGETPFINSVGNWQIGDIDTGSKAQGPQGIQGETGPQGLKGDKGDTGPQGLKGDKGDKGDTGPQGLKGDTGPKGDTGTQGIQGKEGPQGEVGPKGDTGTQGIQGPQGLKGDKGDSGINIINQNTGLDTKIWIGTQSEYDAVVTKDSDTLYMVK